MMNFSRLINLSFALSSGLLLVLAWPPSSFVFPIFFAFVPLFWCAVKTKKAIHFFGWAFLAMLIWNAGTTWWLWNSTAEGAIGAIVANSLLMCIPWLVFFQFKKRNPLPFALLAFIVTWLTFESIHLNWELSWPWLTLGNAFASKTQAIQWYEYTGVGGGSLAILIENCLAFWVGYVQEKKLSKKNIIIPTVLMILFPSLLYLISFLIQQKRETQSFSATKNIVAVQPNIDPYQKFEIGNAASQVNNLIQLSAKNIDTNTAWVLWPETAMSVGEWQNLVTQNSYYQPIFQFAQQHPTISLLSGIETYKNYGITKETTTARKMDNGNYYDAFNAAVHIESNKAPVFYNKSKLVPGVESLPSFLNIMAPVFEQFGGTTGGYGRSSAPLVFKSEKNNYAIAPIICYESIYGEYVSKYVRDGATVLGIITNDGWWGNTPGYKQHLAYAKLRAIENRRWVVRSANTGVSAIINERGEIVQELGWDKAGAIKMNIPVISEQTFYTEQGDYIYEMARAMASLLIFMLLYSWFTHKYFPNNKSHERT